MGCVIVFVVVSFRLGRAVVRQIRRIALRIGRRLAIADIYSAGLPTRLRRRGACYRGAGGGTVTVAFVNRTNIVCVVVRSARRKLT